MNVEIRCVANGYLVKPMFDYHSRGETYDDKKVWVFSNYQSMMNTLGEILNMGEPNDARHS